MIKHTLYLGLNDKDTKTQKIGLFADEVKTNALINDLKRVFNPMT